VLRLRRYEPILIFKKSAFLKGVGRFLPNLHVIGDVSRKPFSTDRYRPVNALQCRWQYSHKATCSRLSSSEVQFTRKTSVLRFEPPLGVWGQRTMFILGSLECAQWTSFSVTELFVRCYGWSATSKYRLKIGVFAPTWSVWPKMSGTRDRPHQPFFLSENYDEWSLMWCTNFGTNFFLLWQCTRLIDRQTDEQTGGVKGTEWPCDIVCCITSHGKNASA